MPAYVRLLRDNEAEVRIAAAGKVTKFCRILSPEMAIQHILPCVKVCLLMKVLSWHFYVHELFNYITAVLYLVVRLCRTYHRIHPSTFALL